MCVITQINQGADPDPTVCVSAQTHLRAPRKLSQYLDNDQSINNSLFR